MQIFEIKNRLQELEIALTQLCSLIASSNTSILCDNELLTGEPGIHRAQVVLKNIWVKEDAIDARMTDVAAGAIEASVQAIETARRINHLKEELKTMLVALRESFSHDYSRSGAAKAFRAHLAEIGLGQLSLRLVYRQIVILDERPKSIRLSYSSKGRSIRKLTAERALQELVASGMSGPHIDVQVDKLLALSNHTHLAQVQELKGYHKANVSMHDQPRHTYPLFLPMLYPEGETKVCISAKVGSKVPSCAPRSDNLIKPLPYIPSLRLHLYRDF